jgi:hypothetical protein
MNLVHRLLSSILKYSWLAIPAVVCLALGASYFISMDAFADARFRSESVIFKPIQVTNSANNGVGSLRWAIDQANQHPDSNLIDLSGINSPIALSSRLPKITSNLTIVGDGNDIINGSHAHQVLWVERGEVTLSHLTIADGLAQGSSGRNGVGGAAGMGGGLFINGGTVTLDTVRFVNNRAIGGTGIYHDTAIQQTEIQQPEIQQLDPQPSARDINPSIQTRKSKFKVNRGAIIGVNGVNLTLDPNAKANLVTIDTRDEKLWANRGAIAGVNGIGIGGIGSIAFGGGGGFGGFGNAGNGGNGGNAGANSGNGGNGGDGGNGGVGIFSSFGLWENQGGIGTVAFGGGGGFGGFGNAGNGGNGGTASPEMAKGGNGGNGGNGGFGGGGGSGGFGGNGGTMGHAGNFGQGGFGGSAGGLGFGGSGGGFGGAIFIKSGRLTLRDTTFEHNVAIGGTGVRAGKGKGKGGAIFVVTEALMKQTGVVTLPKVISLKHLPQFVENVASDAGQTSSDNADIYGTINVE